MISYRKKTERAIHTFTIPLYLNQLMFNMVHFQWEIYCQINYLNLKYCDSAWCHKSFVDLFVEPNVNQKHIYTHANILALILATFDLPANLVWSYVEHGVFSAVLVQFESIMAQWCEGEREKEHTRVEMKQRARNHKIEPTVVCDPCVSYFFFIHEDDNVWPVGWFGGTHTTGIAFRNKYRSVFYFFLCCISFTPASPYPVYCVAGWLAVLVITLLILLISTYKRGKRFRCTHMSSIKEGL